MSEAEVLEERVVDVREIPPHHRHPIIFHLFDRLDIGSSIQLIADHDPRPLRYQFDAGYGDRCKWTYLEQGPDVWRVRLRRETD
jgi:uncharacterized protein (DUF2249 family)